MSNHNQGSTTNSNPQHASGGGGNNRPDRREDSDEKLVTATVARSRSIMLPAGEKRVVGHNPDTGKPIYAPTTRYVEELQEVRLPADEVKRLRSLGYLIDPDRKAAPVSEGPHYTELERTAQVR